METSKKFSPLLTFMTDIKYLFGFKKVFCSQVEDVQGKVGVLDVVARFRVRNMSGYVTVYYNFADHDTEEDVRDLVRSNQDDKKQARREFFAVK